MQRDRLNQTFGKFFIVLKEFRVQPSDQGGERAAQGARAHPDGVHRTPGEEAGATGDRGKSGFKTDA
jgi:hypothetical protein